MKKKISVAALSIALCTTMIGAAFATAAVKPETAKSTGKLVAVAKPVQKAEFMKKHHHKNSSIKTSAIKKK